MNDEAQAVPSVSQESQSTQSSDVVKSVEQPSAITTSGDVKTPATNESSHKAEKLFTRDEVAKIANAEKQKAVEKAKKEFETAQHLQTTPTASAAPIVSNDIAQSTQAPLTAEQITQVQQVIANQATVQAREMFINNAVTNFTAKINDAEKRYEDFHQTVNGLELGKMPPQNLRAFAALLNVADNGADVLYDIAKNPSKFITVINLANANPNLAIREIQRLSQSIKDNDNVSKAKTANPPLSQISPSPTGSDTGTLTIKDYKKMFRG